MVTDRSARFDEHKVYTERRKIPFVYVKVIGTGAVGTVEEVEGTASPFEGQIFARKVITLVNKQQDREAELREIEKEVNILKRAQHNHIVRLVTTYLFDDNYAIIMDPRADGNLEQHLQTANTPETSKKISQWFGCLISGVAYLHTEGIRHRDIKPHNILVKSGNVLLTDFGISMMGLGKTIPTTMIGRPRGRTPEYCAPEVEEGHTRGRSADIFSLGAVFLEMLTACSYLGKLEEFRSRLQAEGRQTYALNVSRAIEWMETLETAPHRAPWHSHILYLCRKMLRVDRYQRPTAGDVRSWWSHQQSSAVPLVTCECSRPMDDLEYYSNGGMNEGLRKAYRNGHRLMVDLLKEEGAKISDNDALVAASEGSLRDVVESLC